MAKGCASNASSSYKGKSTYSSSKNMYGINNSIKPDYSIDTFFKNYNKIKSTYQKPKIIDLDNFGKGKYARFGEASISHKNDSNPLSIENLLKGYSPIPRTQEPPKKSNYIFDTEDEEEKRCPFEVFCQRKPLGCRSCLKNKRNSAEDYFKKSA